MTPVRTARLSDGREVRLREPKAGELRGLSVQALVTMDVGAMLRLLPRISEPALTPAELETLGAADFGELAGIAAGFFIPRHVAAAAGLTGTTPETESPAPPASPTA